MKPANTWDLVKARLTPEDRAALARNGFVSREKRKSGSMTYKLRWRVHGDQRARYLGSDAGQANQVAAAVNALQAPHRLDRELAHLLAAALATLTRIDKIQKPAAEQQGFRPHGYAIRKPRRPKSTVGISSPANPRDPVNE